MWRQAISELRLHPGRFAATLIAIAISVGFVAAISVFINTEQTALGKSNTMELAHADVYADASSGTDPAEVQTAVESVAGVRSVHPLPSAFSTILNHGDASVSTMLYAVPDAELQWSEVVEGRMPTGDGELALSRSGLQSLGVSVGDTVTFSSVEATVVGATNDPKSLWSAIGYFSQDGDSYRWELAVLIDDGGSEEDVAAAVQSAVDEAGLDVTVSTAAAQRQLQLDRLTNDFNIFRYLLQTFGAVALLVGMITIANTFAILVAQRRRQVGLLRAVGASPGQVRRRMVAESFLLGLIGSLLGIALGFGVAAIGGTITGSLYWGFDVRWGELLIALLVGIAATMVSAIVPAVTASRVKPLEALQTVPTAVQARRAGVLRLIVVILAAVFGGGLIALSVVQFETSVLWAVGAGVFLTIAVLGAAPFFVPPLLRLLGAGFARFGPTSRLAFNNAARNPKRAAATATALMLAVGLIVTIQVALATARTSGVESIYASFPVDFSISFADEEVPAELTEQIAVMDNVQGVRAVPAKIINDNVLVYAQNELLRDLGKNVPADAPPGEAEVLLNQYSDLGTDIETLDLPVADGGTITLDVVTTESGVGWQEASVTQETLDLVAGDYVEREIWVTLHDRGDLASINQVIHLLENYPEANFGASGASAILILNQVLDVMLIVLTGLLGVAVVIALVGVSNTLGLSVIERQRESALLRALGMQRAGLRTMLLVEAIALVAVGVVVGLAAGMFFGWLGVSSVVRMIPGDSLQLHFSIDVGYTAGLIAVCLLAAVLASLLPGRKAASASPTEALAAE